MAAQQANGKGKNPAYGVGHLPINELLFERQGAPSPFGEDIQFPLPVDQLPYTHPSTAPLDTPPADSAH
jgi:succinate dehydrogenase / fumarate reductase iron-sulfur subunit